MRIAIVAPYQGPTLAARRPIDANLSLGARTKISIIAELLLQGGHSAEIVSQGEVVELRLRYYPGFAESEFIGGSVPIRYASVVPIRFVNGLWSSLACLRLLKARHRARPFDLLFIYNLKLPQVICARYAVRRLGIPVVLEYEDDHFLDERSGRGSRLTANLGVGEARKILHSLSGCLAGSGDLLSQMPATIPQLLLPGVVAHAIATAVGGSERKNRVVFSGTHSPAQGLEQLVKAWKILQLPGWELHIAGHGAVTSELHRLASDDATTVFHGVLGGTENAELLASGKIAVVPYEVSTTRGFSFKTIEALAAGLHVLTTRLSALDSMPSELTTGLTYLDDNTPETIARTLSAVVTTGQYQRTARDATLLRYGPAAASHLLHGFLDNVMKYHNTAGVRGVVDT